LVAAALKVAFKKQQNAIVPQNHPILYMEVRRKRLPQVVLREFPI
jgi:hypothetical protein